ncbi:MAG: MBL fold metallo-hydrolase [Dehalococcoidia bacterium]|nr:MBL fold metallo-hydrolase [Dehalococcoidia bacterium]
MEITWLGQACFKIRGKEATIITDPYDPALGYVLGNQTAEIVTVSHDHKDHNYYEGIGGSPKLVKGPGEYDIAGILITGINTFHDNEGGKKRGKNTVYLIEMEDLTICHLGDLGHVPTAEQVELLSNVQILMIPVGGIAATIDASAAVETISLIQPKIVIPMHYKTDALTYPFDSVDKFLKEMGVTDIRAQPKLTVTKSSVPEHTQVVVLDYKR